VQSGDLDEAVSVAHNRAVHEAFLQAIMPRLDALGLLVKEARETRQHYGWLPDVDSEGMRELAEESRFVGAWGQEPVRACHTMATVLLVGAEDHARSITELLLLERAPLYGHVVLARSALEMSARVLWLCEVGIGVRLRVARGYTDALDNLNEQRRLPGNPVPSAVTRRDRIIAEARRQHFNVIRKDRKPPAIEHERPSKTSLMRALLGAGGDADLGALLYSFYSAVAHGTAYGLLQQFDRVEPPSKLSALATARPSVNSDDVRSVVTAMVLGYGRAVKELHDLMGWNGQEWLDAYTSAHRVIVPSA
jgi:hypothetical protein